MIDVYEELIKMKNAGVQAMMVTVTEKLGNAPVAVGKKMLVDENNVSYGTVGGGALELCAKNKCIDLLKKQLSMTEKYVLNEGDIVEGATALPMACGGSVTLFYEYIGVQGYVYIFGGGHVGQALTKIIKTLEFHVTVIDHREEYLKLNKEADELVLSDYEQYIDKHGIKKNSYVIICTPSHKHDYTVVTKIFELKRSQPKYMGMLCSKIKLNDFMQKTREKLGNDLDLSHFYSPIGLNTGGRSPEEIAISIGAEILAVHYNKKGHLHMRKGNIIDYPDNQHGNAPILS